VLRAEACAAICRAFSSVPLLEVGRDAGAAEGVVAHLGGDAGGIGSAAHHPPGVDAVEPFPRQFPPAHDFAGCFHCVVELVTVALDSD